MDNNLTYKVEGGRVGVLLIHGLGGTPTEMRFVANGFARAGYTVHCVQMAGHGGTEADLRDSSWQDWYTSAEDALFELRQSCDTVIVGGLSTGALIALMLAARHPDEVQATVSFAPTLWLNGWRIPWYARFFRLIQTKWFAELFNFPDLRPHGIKDERIRAFIESSLFTNADSPSGVNRAPGGVVFEHRQLVRAVTRKLGMIVQPALILHSREDDYADINNAWYLQRRLAGTVEMTVLNDCYHVITVDRQRHTVVDKALSFVSRIVGLQERAANASVEAIGRPEAGQEAVAAA